MGLISQVFGTYSDRQIKKIMPLVKQINSLGDKYKNMSDSDMRSQTDIFKKRLAAGETLDDILPEAYACIREASTEFSASVLSTYSSWAAYFFIRAESPK